MWGVGVPLLDCAASHHMHMREQQVVRTAGRIILSADKDCPRQIGVVDQLEAAFAAGLTSRGVRSVFRIVDKGLGCFCRWKLQKCNEGGIQRLALERGKPAYM